MSPAQKKAQATFKKAIAYRKKTGCTLKQAFAYVKGEKVGAVKKKAVKKAAKKKVVKKAAKKKSPAKSYHKDTASHNVRISVVSGIAGMKTAAKKLLSDKYGDLAAKKLHESTKRGKKKIQKQMSELAAKIKKVVNL
jgi:FtsZ-interacting cell division protein ZipA